MRPGEWPRMHQAKSKRSMPSVPVIFLLMGVPVLLWCVCLRCGVVLAVVARALPKIENANVRVRLLQEYAMRTRGLEGEEIAGVFREIALNDDFPQARAEAITILGRRGRPEERDILERKQV